MKRILGIDPGSRITGYGVIEQQRGVKQSDYLCLASGCIRIDSTRSLAERLGAIFGTVAELIDDYRPDEMAIEQVFVHHNADAALKLGQARGAAICAGAQAKLPVSEYAPRAIKQAVVGKGGAAKEQVQHMVQVLLKLDETPSADAADALAVALCHSHSSLTQTKTGIAPALLLARRSGRRRRWR